MTANDLIMDIVYEFEKHKDIIWFTIFRNKNSDFISLVVKKPLHRPFILRISKQEFFTQVDVKNYVEIIKKGGEMIEKR